MRSFGSAGSLRVRSGCAGGERRSRGRTRFARRRMSPAVLGAGHSRSCRTKSHVSTQPTLELSLKPSSQRKQPNCHGDTQQLWQARRSNVECRVHRYCAAKLWIRWHDLYSHSDFYADYLFVPVRNEQGGLQLTKWIAGSSVIRQGDASAGAAASPLILAAGTHLQWLVIAFADAAHNFP